MISEEERNAIVQESTKRASELVLDTIGDKITDLVLNQIYQDIGRGVVRKALWVIGVITVIGMAWLAAKFGVKS